MKPFAKFATKLLIFFSMSLIVLAADVKLAWDLKIIGDSRTGVRVYEKMLVGAVPTYVLLGTVSDPVNTFTIPNVPAGTHTYVVRAFNAQDESIDSTAVIAIILPNVNGVTGVTITILP